MSQRFLVAVSIEGYLIFFSIMAIVIGLIYWTKHKKAHQIRSDYFSAFAHADLRMSPYKLGLVYKVVSTSDDDVIVVPIWNKGKPIFDGEEIGRSADSLIPFDPDRFA